MLVLLGCNHRSAPVELRERLAIDEADLPDALLALSRHDGIREAMILSTCNRVEVLARSERAAPDALRALEGFLSAERGVTREELDRHSYRLSGRDAIRHVFQVASGLNSLILGEPQVLGQVKRAYRAAKRAGATGPVLERMLQQCLATAKRVRTRTGIARHPVSVAYAAVHLARQIFGDLQGRWALLLGAGKMAELVARHLTAGGIEQVEVASRTFDRAMATARRCGGRAVHWADGLSRLSEVDVVVSCTGAARPIVRKADVARAMRKRRGAPLFLIDIAVPRDIEPEVNQLDNVYLYDIDGLQDVVDANLDERRAAAERARREIDVDVEAFERWRQSLEVTPTIVALRQRLLGTASDELERFRRRLGPLTIEQQDAVEGLTRGLVRKILHRPIVRLRRAVERGDVESCTALYREIFGLADEEPAPPGQGREGAAATPDGEEPGAARGPSRVLRGGKEPR